MIWILDKFIFFVIYLWRGSEWFVTIFFFFSVPLKFPWFWTRGGKIGSGDLLFQVQTDVCFLKLQPNSYMD